MCEEYNGWKNYQTGNILLWLDNDQDTHFQFTERAAEIAEDDTGTLGGGGTWTLAQEIEEFISDQNPVADDASMWNDIMGFVLGGVNWYEIAESFLETARDYARAEV